MGKIPKLIRQYLLHDLSGNEQPLKLTIIYSLPFIVLLAGLLLSLAAWEISKHRNERTEQLTDTARAFYDQILVEKQWFDSAGGTLVRRNGEQINFASMIREMSSIANRYGVYKVQVIGMGLSGKHHVPDEWEKETLDASKKSNGEAYLFKEADGISYFRYFRPLPITGAVEAGIGLAIDIPTEVYDRIHSEKVMRDIMSYGIVGGVSLMFIVLIVWKFSRKISSVINKEMEETRLKAAMELAGAAAHEMRQPLQVVMGFADILDKRIQNGENVDDAVSTIKDQCRRTDRILQKMLNITHYKTLDYPNGMKIFDLHAQDDEKCMN